MGVTGSWHWAAWHRDNNVTVGPHPAQVSFQWRLRAVREGPASASTWPCCEISLGGSEARLNTRSQTDSPQGNMDPQNNVCISISNHSLVGARVTQNIPLFGMFPCPDTFYFRLQSSFIVTAIDCFLPWICQDHFYKWINILTSFSWQSKC